MLSSMIASLALFTASALAGTTGNAIVVNSCTYDVYLAGVPAESGGYNETDTTLKPGQSWSQVYTKLTNGDGWSIKLSQSKSLENIMQYEYTFHDDGTIWYDLSDVNGNPWDGNWEITADSELCNPKQQAYRFSTDDAYGMQACPQDTNITVTVCSGNVDNGGVSSVASSVAAKSTVAETSHYTAPSSTPVLTSEVYATPSTSLAFSTQSAATISAEHSYTAGYSHGHFYEANVAASPSPTTFATSTTALVMVPMTDAGGVTVVEVETAVVTDIVTAYNKRHEHHPHAHPAA